MHRILNPYAGHAYAALRIVAGFLWACHGAQKMFGVLGGTARWDDPLRATAGVIELFGGTLIAFGLLTGVVAFLASGQMAAAYFIAHAPRGFWPAENGGELAVLYCFLFLYIAGHGAGRFSLDGVLERTRGARTPASSPGS